MGTIMNESLKSAASASQPQVRWVDLSMHTLKLVVAYDVETNRKRLCLLGPLSLAQRRMLERDAFYEEQGYFFRDELNFKLSQFLAIFPYAKSLLCDTRLIGVTKDQLSSLQQDLRKLAVVNPTIVTTPATAEQVHQHPLSNPTLSIEPVPLSSRFASVRAVLGHEQFNTLKKAIFTRAGYRCEICLENGFEQGHDHPAELHEVFQYDDVRGTQKLTALLCLCPNCNAVKQIELSRAKGDDSFQSAMAQLNKVNAWNSLQGQTYYQHAYSIWQERSKKVWQLNLDLLAGTGFKLPKELSVPTKRLAQGNDLLDSFPYLNSMTSAALKRLAT